MLAIAQWLYVVAVAVWLGTTVFVSLFAAPAVFRSFPVEEAGRVMSALFPDYYRVGYGCGLVLLVASAVCWRAGSAGAGRWGIATGVAALMLAAVLYAGIVIQPRAHAARSQLHEAPVAANIKAEFDRLHRRSVQLNGFVLLGNLVLASIAASRLCA